MIIDIHHHLGSEPGYTRKLLRVCDKLGIDYVCAMGIPGYLEFSANDQIERAMKDSLGRIKGFAYIDLGRDRPDKVDEMKDRGFTGLKFIKPKHAYDHGSFFPVYERAEALGMPGLFHLGIVAARPADRDKDVSSARMRAIMLDPLCRAFPDWIIIGAHLGNPNYTDATMCARWHVNLYFDLTGSTLKKISPEELNHWLWWKPNTRYRDPKRRDAWEKILFGSDVPADEIHDVMNDYRRVMDTLKIKEHIRRKIWGDTAAKILGIKP
ncbi:MAG TPA: amidohydrolase family protein [Planctomycetota bacterium]|nr:amidohydrolase family protein [Planctomycetota bacterium]